ncbi:MAG: glycosyltransferase family 4 protein [Tepidisphaeraceae bacterium]
MKIVICWSHISGYMAACWRALAAVPGVEVFVLGFQSDAAVAPFDPALLGNVRHLLMDDKQRLDVAFVHQTVAAEKPDVLTISGWANPGLRPLASHAAFKHVFRIMMMDTPMRYDWRQAVGKQLLRGYLKNFDRVMVPGERAFAYARYLGFPDNKIRKGTYGIDFDAFAPSLGERLAQPGGWPRRFLFMGRYAPEKGLDTLIDAYARYRREAAAPWELVCFGRGPDAAKLANQPGVTDRGFISPTEQPRALAEAGAFVLASRFDPWPLVCVEAAASGLPLVCSTACGSPVEVLRDGFNGYQFATGDAEALCRRLHQVSARADLADWGRRSQAFAERTAPSTGPSVSLTACCRSDLTPPTPRTANRLAWRRRLRSVPSL